MKKIVKTLFGRIAIIALSVCLQTLILLAFFVFCSEKYWVFQLLNIFIASLVFLNIVQRDMYPDAKLPWLAVILAMPFLGTALYLLFASNSMSRRQKRLLKLAAQQAELSLPKQPEAALEAPYRGQSNYIKTTTGLPVYANSRCDYYPSGEEFYAALKEDIAGAKKFIFLEYFIIERGAMWDGLLSLLTQKAKDGVEVRVMYDDIGSAGKVPARYYKTLRALGLQCVKFNPFHAVISGVHNNRDHRKIAVIDGKTAYVSGANLADEYINAVSPYGHWKDSAVRLQGQAVNSLTAMFLTSYSVQSGAAEEMGRYMYDGEDTIEGDGFIQPYGDGPAPAYADHVGENVYINMIYAAQKYLYITTPYLIIDHELQTALRCAAQRGVDVRIVTPHVPDKRLVYYITRSNYKILMESGIKIYEYTPGFIHAKNFLADGEAGVVGTVNLDYRSLTHHYECGVWMCKTGALAALKEDFDAIFTQSRLQDMQSVRAGFFQRFFCAVTRLFTPLL